MTQPRTMIEVFVSLSGGEQLPLAEAAGRHAVQPGAFGKFLEQEGQVVLRRGDAALLIEDVLAYVLPALVFEVLPRLGSEGSARLVLMSSSVDVDFREEGGAVTARTKYDPPIEMPAEDFKVALLAVARSFADVAVVLWPGSAEARQLQGALAMLPDRLT